MKRIVSGVDRVLASALAIAQKETRPNLTGVTQFAWIALGYYGRREMSFHSDIEYGVVYLIHPNFYEASSHAYEANNNNQHRQIREGFKKVAIKARKIILQHTYLVFDEAGNTPDGANAAKLVGTPEQLANSMLALRNEIGAHSNMLLDARFIEGQAQENKAAFQELENWRLRVMMEPERGKQILNYRGTLF
jgi:Putative nucleotidyltransferase DUF294